MADANARLVHANSWPLLQYTTSNENEHGEPIIVMGVVNSGVGPAKIESFEILWNGRPVESARALLTACCGLQPGQMPAIADAKGTVAEQISQIRTASKSGLSSSQMAPAVISAHEGQSFLTLPLTDQSAPVFQRLNAVRTQVAMRACYCSVFDECWVSDLRSLNPKRVDVCPKSRWNIH
jgi:hypothetical protein